jgi:uncharacterized protein YbaA (DUF1428 family)
VAAIPEDNFDAYRRMARKMGKIFIDHGAVEYIEAKADDVPEGKSTSFSKSVKRKDGEIVVVAFLRFKTRAHRDRVQKKVMEDPRMAAFDHENLPFDPKRMFFGGFKEYIALKP